MHTLTSLFTILLMVTSPMSVGSISAGEANHDDPAGNSGRRAESVGAYAGWYREHDGQGWFQACGSEAAYRVAPAADLLKKVREFDLQPDMPVYVRLEGVLTDGMLKVSQVRQFGSETPVRDCALTGVVTAP